MLYETRGIILSQMDLGEHDRVISVLSKEEGLLHAVVKGARRPKSKLAAVTQPHTQAVLQLYRGRNLDRVTQVELETTHPGIASDYTKMIYAAYLSELLRGVMPPRETNRAMFDFYALVLSCLEEKQDPWSTLIWGALGVLIRAGFGPSFTACVFCGETVSADAGGDETYHFSARDGGLVCSKCRGSGSSPNPLPEITKGAARTLGILADLAAKSGPCPNVNAVGSVRSQVQKTIVDYCEEVLGKPAKSASLLISVDPGFARR